jgi:hypothetical protein
MDEGETVKGTLLGVGSAYTFETGKFFNLEGSKLISVITPLPKKDCIGLTQGVAV